MALIGSSAAGFVLADGERRRIQYIRAMRRCLMRMADLISYDEPPLRELLLRLELRATQQERQIARALQECATELDRSTVPLLRDRYQAKMRRVTGYGALDEEDKAAFETALCELGRTGKQEQLRLLSCADERLRGREEAVGEACVRRAKLMSALGVTCGAALFLLLL